ncbi:MAG: hypothetical protein WDW36_003763 [Sanguina aurantia]
MRHYQNEAEAARNQSAAAAEELKVERMGLDLFDSELKARHRDRAAYLGSSEDPLLGVVTDRLLDRLEDCVRKFPVALVLGGAAEQVIRGVAGGRAGIQKVIYMDSSSAMLDRVKRCAAAAALASKKADGADPSGSSGSSGSTTPNTPSASSSRSSSQPAGPAGFSQEQHDISTSTSGPAGSSKLAAEWPEVEYVQAGQEYIPLQPGTVDVVISSLGLHWVNDLPGAMAQARIALKPDGLFLAAMYGGETLQELRISCALAQMEREGGVSAFVSPLAQVRDAGNLLTRAGLAMPAVDLDTFKLHYPTPLDLVTHLRSMGEGNANVQRRKTLNRDTALAASATYHSMFGEDDGTIPATFQVMYMTGWSPHASQPKAKERGSATVSFQALADGLVQSGTAQQAGSEDGMEVETPAGPVQGTP